MRIYANYLGRVRHLVVDEAQDIVGIRADLMISVIGRPG
jgi:superfamily I DNA/RNA helicase